MRERKSRFSLSVTALGTLAIALTVMAGAQERASQEDEARALIEAVLAETASEAHRGMQADLEAWTETVIARGLSEAGLAGAGPAGADAAGNDSDAMASVAGASDASGIAGSAPPGRGGGSEVIVFMSLAVPEPAWRQWSGEAARIDAPLVLRGVRAEGLAATARAIRERQAGDGAGIGIDPRLFRLFRVGHVPAVAVVPGGVPPCESRGCSADPPPPHDLVTGNIGLDAALEAIAREGNAGRAAARRQLQVLRGEGN